MMEMINIALIDDHRLFRKGIEEILKKNEAVSIVYECGSAQEFLDWLENGNPAPDVILLDVEMPGMNGLELLQKLRVKYAQVKTIILSMHFRESLIAELMRNGANGYLSKNCDEPEFFHAILTVSKTDFYFSETALRVMHKMMTGLKKKKQHLTGITPREKEVLQLICREHTAAEIAAKLFLSIRTIEGYRNTLLQKTGAKNTAGLVLFAVRNAVIDPWF